MTFTLINARPSPFGRKVAIALIEKGIAYEVRYDVPWGRETCTPQYSPLEQLPILLSAAGEAVYDSTYILEWLESRYPNPALLPADPELRLQSKQRQMLGERLMEVAQSLIFETHRPDPSDAWIERQSRKLHRGFGALEHLHAGRSTSDRASIDLGDIAIGTTALVFEFAVAARLCRTLDALVWRGRYPALTGFLEQLEARPSFVATLPRPMDVDLQATVR